MVWPASTAEGESIINATLLTLLLLILDLWGLATDCDNKYVYISQNIYESQRLQKWIYLHILISASADKLTSVIFVHKFELYES